MQVGLWIAAALSLALAVVAGVAAIQSPTVSCRGT